MKTVNTKLLAPLTTTELTNLASEIKETVASEHQQKKVFSSADLWNIRRTRRVMADRRGYYGW
ncbi:MAG: hypothetical protein KF781_09485 [Chitinophagaceae bacterium]|nr:hypothetical protein [Chitinophagaceae bacterium]MCW5905475.1 hypothetical protein [Chitinophagaceae bacterium]